MGTTMNIKELFMLKIDNLTNAFLEYCYHHQINN